MFLSFTLRTTTASASVIWRLATLTRSARSVLRGGCPGGMCSVTTPMNAAALPCGIGQHDLVVGQAGGGEPQAFVERQPRCVFGVLDVGRDRSLRRIVGHHRVQVLIQNARQACSIAGALRAGNPGANQKSGK